MSLDNRAGAVAGILGGSWMVCRAAGIPIRLHWSLLILALAAYPDLGLLVVPALAVFLLSVALHELGHSVVAQDCGLRVREILLTPLGGIAMIQGFRVPPAEEMRITAAGPLVSLALAAVTAPVAWVLSRVQAPLASTLVFWMGVVPNLALFLFNLLPAFPMDGGRLLRAALTESRGRLEATRLAALIGRALAAAFGLYALVFLRDLRLVLLAGVVWMLAGFEYHAEKFHAQREGTLFDVDGDGEPDAVVVGPPPYARPRAAGLWREVRAAAASLIRRIARPRV